MLLYAQWPAAISRLTVDHIEETNGTVRISLGELHADLANPWLVRARQAARALGEARGWSRWITERRKPSPGHRAVRLPRR